MNESGNVFNNTFDVYRHDNKRHRRIDALKIEQPKILLTKASVSLIYYKFVSRLSRHQFARKWASSPGGETDI